MKYLKTAFAGISTLVLCVLLMTAVNFIPTSMIQNGSEKSAEYLKRIELFHYTNDDLINSVQDNYADAKWMGVVYSIDPEHPFISEIWARYAQLPYENINESFYKQVHGNEGVNETYSRYWHGAMTYIRPLLLITDLSGIRICLGVIILLLQGIIAILLFRMKGPLFMLCYLLAFLTIHPWMLFKSLEYSSLFVIVSIVSIAVLLVIKADRQDLILPLFAASGVLSCFYDFLTIETLSFSLPMVFFILYLMENDVISDVRSGVAEIVKCGITWFLGYVLTFGTKLMFVYFICGKEEVKTALSVAAERVSGDVYLGNTVTSPAATTGQRFSGAIWRNVAALFPTHAYKMSVQNTIIAAGAVLIISAVVIYLFHLNVKGYSVILLTAIALMPYARYLALSSHSYAHYFFTYRAQMVTVFVLYYMLFEYGIKNIPYMLNAKKGAP